jgi:hypothetical protein
MTIKLLVDNNKTFSWNKTIIDFGIGCYLVYQPLKTLINPDSNLFQSQWQFGRTVKVLFFPIYFYTLRGWYHFPDTCQDIFLAERVILQVLKTSLSVCYLVYQPLKTLINPDSNLFQSQWLHNVTLFTWLHLLSNIM